jgi:hypothetical protein
LDGIEIVLLLDSRALRRDSDREREGLEGVWINLDVEVESESDRGVDRMTCWNGSRGGILGGYDQCLSIQSIERVV